MLQDMVKKLRQISTHLTVLYAEDDPENAEAVKDLLTKIFTKVDWVENGEEAFSLFQKQPYDIVITDFQMPKMNGLELAKKIKEQNKEQIIIVTSAHDESDTLIDMIELGIDKFILKPIDIKNFFMEIAKIIINLYNEKRKAILEKQLFEELKINEAILNKLVTPIVIVEDTTVVYANEKFLRYFNITKENLNGFHLKALFEDDTLKILDNQELLHRLEEANGSIWMVFTGTSQKAQRYTINISPIQDTNKKLLCFLNIEFINTEIIRLKNSTASDPLTGLLSKKRLIADLTEALGKESSKSPYEIICFGLKHTEKFIHKFGTANLQDVYRDTAKKLQRHFKQQLDVETLRLYYLSENHYLAITDKKNTSFIQEELKTFDQHYAYKQSYTVEPLMLDQISFTLDTTMPMDKILADIDNKLRMLVS